MKVNIYLETDKQNQECTWRKYGYVLEAMAGRCIPVTRVGFGSAEGTYHKCNLQALEEALVRFHKECEVCVYTKDAFVAARILKIDEMAATDFKDTKGKPIKNAKEWESICRKIKECSIVISSHSGKHTYSVWMQEEMKKIENCLECGQCMKKCPYELNTPELLKKNYEDYKKVLAGEVSVN